MLHKDFTGRTKDLLCDEYDEFEASLDMQPHVSIRINPHKPAEAYNDLISDNTENVQWCKTGRYLPKRPSFTFDPLFHAGTYYVQEASSMFLEQAVNRILTDTGMTDKQITALDLCAAPGGKSTHLQTLLPKGSLLVSNEVIRSRCMILAENTAKWGIPDNIVTNNDPKGLGRLANVFDIIVADMPCSGEGMFRKDIASRDEWSVDNVKLCASRQRRIIHDVWNALKPGGWLIYSTCTFNTEENEENVYTLATELGAEIISIPVNSEWNITGALCHNIPAYRFFPHRTKGEGFFLALLQKKGRHTEIKKTKNNIQQATIPGHIKDKLSEPEKFSFYTRKNTAYDSKQPEKQQSKHTQETIIINAIPTTHDNIYNILSGHTSIISAGVLLGELKGKDFIPSVQLAMSTELCRERFASVELSYEQSIKYLQKEAVILPEDTPTGYILVTFRNAALGFVKNIGNRANNLYPQEWRIRNRK
jgi:tRNA and rRNA cytosine-C5-methylases